MSTGIEWTEVTWNPATGCTKVSPGCANCYIENQPSFRIAHRRFEKGVIPIELHENRLDHPLHWKKPRLIFVNSMSDLFHDAIPDTFIDQVFATAERCPQHAFQVLTKRPVRMLAYACERSTISNVWLGVSVENQHFADERIPILLQTPAAVRFLSCEPLLGPLHLPLDRIDWVIVGGESGPGHRRIDPAWVRDVRDQCIAAGVPFFFKQWGGITSKAGGRELDGRIWDEMPR